MLRSALTLDASMTVQDAMAVLAAYPDSTDIVIQRRKGIELCWYAKNVGDIRRLASSLDSLAVSLTEGFSLHLGPSSNSFQISKFSRDILQKLSGVLLDGEQVLGVLESLMPYTLGAEDFAVQPREQPETPTFGAGGPSRHFEVTTYRDRIEMSTDINGVGAGGQPPQFRRTMARPMPEETAAGTETPKGRARHTYPTIDTTNTAEVGRPRPHFGGTSLPTEIPQNVNVPEAPEKQSINAYPRLDAPDQVKPGQKFDLTIGLSHQQSAGVAGGLINIITAEEEFDIDVHVIAPDFQAPDGIQRSLHVRRGRIEEAETKVTLIAPQVADALDIKVEYFYQGEILGRAWRQILVTPSVISVPAGAIKSGATPIENFSAGATPDLTVTISVNRDDSTLTWNFDAPPPVQLSSPQACTELPEKSAQNFTIQIIQKVQASEGTLSLNNNILGMARIISGTMPSEFWKNLGVVWAHVNSTRPGQVPSLILVSEDPYIPWELASTQEDWVDPSLVDAGRPPLLGAQLKVGRWLPPGIKTRQGLNRPKLRPETNVNIKKIAVVVGNYREGTENRPLPQAKEEGDKLKELYNAIPVNCTSTEVDKLLENKLTENEKPVNIQAIHFACHGEVDPNNPHYSGIILSDTNARIGELEISGNNMTRQNEPFVFANACQLGQAGEMLAGYGGLAGAFLKESCRGFIAPLWSVKDEVAKELALEFYKRTLVDNIEVSEVMRELRSKFDMNAESPQSTYLAYIFYGHPKLRLSKAD